MSCKYLIVFISAVIAALALPAAAQAQTAQIDWANAGVPSQGSFPNGTTVTASDGTVATVTFNSVEVGGGTFDPVFAPTFLSYFNGTLSTSTSPLFVSMNNSDYDPRDRITVTIELDQAVNGLQFSLGDIDFGNFTDAIEVYHDSDLSGAFTNSAAAGFGTFGASVQRTNDAVLNGWRGINGSANDSTAGSINFDFGNQSVQRIQLVYFSYTGTGDPGNQFYVISDFTYDSVQPDLSLSKSVSNANPAFGSTISYQLNVTNSGVLDATGVEVLDQLPTGFEFVSASGTGNYDAVTGLWTVGNVPSGQTRSLTITGTVSAPAGVTVTNFAEVSASDQGDSDSTPGNGIATEDDYDFASFTVQGVRTAGVPPTLVCPVGVTTFDWDAPGIVWQAGVLNQSFAIANFGTVDFAISSDGVFVSDPAFNGQSPSEATANTGGLPTVESSLHQFLDFANRQQTATTVVSLPNAVAGAQFTLFDIDFAANDFADQVTVTGTYQGSSVIPVLTNGTANYVVGNVGVGDAGSDGTSAAGNIVVTFNQPVDTITIEYGNAGTAPVVPDGQAIAIHDFDFCTPTTALSVTKIGSVISDPVNGSNNAKAIPGAVVEYLISVSNTGISSTTADSVIVTDDHPGDLKMCRILEASGPVVFNDPGNDTGLTYTFAGIGIGTDDLEFSNDNGATFNYTPVDDGEGCDANITDFRLNPAGEMAGGSTFNLRVRYTIIDSGLPTP
ncbi:MAG: DUF11 domain-containing protein [Pseudomonadota bacterium]|nr:DUF11 domain-containing protein [Pseudomonadota bacterium]